MPDPEQRERRLRLRGLSINRLLPNIITLSALCAGLTAIRFGLNGDFRSAVLAIIAAAFLDALDGRVARRLNATSRFGAELDSLSDVIAFGVAPAFLMYLSIMSNAGTFGWVVTLMFPICSALRLARFNVGIYADEKPPVWAGAYFTGVPAPAGALLVIMPLMLSLSPDVDWSWLRHPVTGAVFLVGIGALMISALPSWSLKRGRIPGPWVVPTLVLVALAIGLMVTTPWTTLPLIGLVYLLLLPFSYASYRRTAAREMAHASAASPSIVELRAVGDSSDPPRR